MDARTQTLIERRDARRLDELQIRGDWQYGLARDGEWSFVGYDYANQQWIEHVWQVNDERT